MGSDGEGLVSIEGFRKGFVGNTAARPSDGFILH
jgi:hypothetical protein